MVNPADTTETRLGVYTVERELGRGGMGTVMLGRDTALDRPVAIKILPPELARNLDYVNRFVREARTAAKINHPNVVQVYGAGFEQKTAFIAMELVPGGTLKELAKQVDPFPMRLAAEIVRDAALGLSAAHDLDIIHRDLKPDNVLLTPQGQIKLADFGLAFQTQGQRITVSGTYLGTPQYSSPEQCNGETLTPASDLYALGVILFELLSGKPPYDAPTPLALFHRILTQPTPPLGEVRPELPKSLVAVVERLLQKNPADRYQTATALVDDLARVIEGLPEEGPRPCVGDSTPGGAFVVSASEPTRIETPVPSSTADTLAAPATPLPQTPLPAEVAALGPAGSPPAPSGEGRENRRVGALGALAVLVVLALAGALLWSGVVTPTQPGDVALVGWKASEKGAPQDWEWLGEAMVDFLEAELSEGRQITVMPEGYTGSPLAFLRTEGSHFTIGGTYYKVGDQVAVTLDVKDAQGQLLFSDFVTCSQDAILSQLATFAVEIRVKLDEKGRVPATRQPPTGDRTFAEAPKAGDALSGEVSALPAETAQAPGRAGETASADPAEFADGEPELVEQEQAAEKKDDDLLGASSRDEVAPTGLRQNSQPEQQTAPTDSIDSVQADETRSANATTADRPARERRRRQLELRADEDSPRNQEEDLDDLDLALDDDEAPDSPAESKPVPASGDDVPLPRGFERNKPASPEESVALETPKTKNERDSRPVEAPPAAVEGEHKERAKGRLSEPTPAQAALALLEAARADGKEWTLRKAFTAAGAVNDPEVDAVARALASEQSPACRRFLLRQLDR